MTTASAQPMLFQEISPSWPYSPQNMLPFIDLKAQHSLIEGPIEAAFRAVMEAGAYIMGPQVRELELALGARTSTTALGCASGTDALLLALMAFDVGPGDAVFVPSFTFAATAEVVKLLHATPIFVDVLDDTFCMDPKSLSEAIEAVERQGDLKPRVVIAVDLFGQPADYASIVPICKEKGLKLVGDCAQSCGALYKGQPVETFSDIAATSFYPAKPFGCYGDGGAVFVPKNVPQEAELVQKLKSMRAHGEGRHRYEHIRVGMTGRLDTLQAAFLLEKLKIFKDECHQRQAVADRYDAGLRSLANRGVLTPYVAPDRTSVWAQYTLKVPNRPAFQDALQAQGIPTVVYYPIPLHRQKAYEDSPCAPGGLPVTEALATQVVSLPMHPYLSPRDQEGVIQRVRAFFDKRTTA